MKITSKISFLVLSLALSASALLAQSQTDNDLKNVKVTSGKIGFEPGLIMPSSNDSIVNVTEADAGTTITLHLGQTLCVTLAPGPSDGTDSNGSPSYCDCYFVQPTWNTGLLYQNALPSGANHNIYSFAPTGAMLGQTTLSFSYGSIYAPFHDSRTAPKIFTINVVE